MAARSKKKSSLSQTGQEAQSAVMESLVTETETPQELLGISSEGLVASGMDLLPGNPNGTGQFEAGDSEETMDTDTGLLKTQSPDEALADDVVDSVINLEPTLSIQNVVKLYDKLKKVYAAYDSIEIDASHVSSVDTATLQLFAALKKDAVKQNKEVVFFQPSPRFVESARLLDLIDMLEIIDV